MFSQNKIMSTETLQITLDNALEAFNKGTDSDRVLLERLFPGKLKMKTIFERVTTLKEACDELGIDFEGLFDDCEDDYEKAETAIKTFAKALREGKAAKECFFYPYFYTAGGGFSLFSANYVQTSSVVGARLRVDSSEKAKHLGKCMESYYKTYLLGE